MSDKKIFICENIGISGTTPCYIRPMADGRFEARMGIALLGSTNMSEEEFEACNFDPFHDRFYDNYARGIGDTEKDAIQAMNISMADTCNSLWD